MQLDRIDLADIHDPRRIAREVHLQLGRLEPPVRVTEIARALGIIEVKQSQFDGFEGMLLTDRVRSRGAILANTRHGAARARFTIAHELGHFLMEWHEFSGPAGFKCSAQDMRETREGQREMRQEVEANRFAIELLAPPPLVDPNFSDEPDLRDAQRLRGRLRISLEAAVRRMVDRHSQCLAAVWSADRRIRYVHRHKEFPWIKWSPRDPVPRKSLTFRVASNGNRGFTDWAEVHSIAWTDVIDIEIWEQVRIGSNGHAVTLLWADIPDDDNEDEPVISPRFWRHSGKKVLVR